MSLEDRFKSITEQGTAVGAKPYLVLDASWQQELAGSIRSKREDGWEPLLGSSAEKKQEAHYRTPLLVDLNVYPEVVTAWLAEGFTEKLGIIVFSGRPIEELRTSLKRFISVITPESGKPVYLRFYDARVLYCFLRHGFPEQWQDFFKDIELIAAPYDYTSSFAIYRLREDILQFGVETEDGKDYRWFTHENKDRAVDNYQATFPFRQIEQRQYDDMMWCANETLLLEIEQLLERIKLADPVLRQKFNIDDLRKLLAIAERHDCFNEQCKIYFCIAALLFGKNFHRNQDVIEYWKCRYRLREELLSYLIYSYANRNNIQILIKLISPWIQ